MIEAIRDSAFVTSEYPVILSFENHCRYTITFLYLFLFGHVFVSAPYYNLVLKIIFTLIFDLDI